MHPLARRPRAALLMTGLLALGPVVVTSGCSGSLDGTGSKGDDKNDEPIDEQIDDLIDNPENPAITQCDKVGPSPIRRLSRAEYLATLRDLFPGVDTGAPTVTPDPVVDGFENRADKLFATESNVGDFSRIAQHVAGKAAADPGQLIDCAADAGKACGEAFVADFGQRAFRRPLTDDERARYQQNFETVRAEVGFAGAVQLTIEAMLQSVNFLYRLDLAEGEPVADGRVRVGAYEMAARLSYLLWGTMPDAELFAAADKGELESDDDIIAQARRMLRDPRLSSQMIEFHRQWLDYDHIQVTYQREGDKDKTLYPEYDDELRAAMREENDRFTALVMEDGSRSLADLLTSRETFVNAPLARLYGVAEPADGWERVSLPDGERAGILTRAANMASRAHKFSGSPPLRAVFVMRRLMCMPELIPSPDADTSEPVQQDGEPPRTNRQLFETRVAESNACKSCHTLIDPIGFTFEHYDALGRYRSEDNGLPVDASGALTGADVEDPEVANAIELSGKLAESRQVHACMARHWLSFATGLDPDEEDCRVERLTDILLAAKGDQHVMLLGLVKSPDFLTRPVGP